VSKHKQKAKKHHFNTAYRKPLLAAIGFMIVATPASWFLVSAQSSDGDALTIWNGQNQKAGSDSAGSTGGSTGGSTVGGADKKSADTSKKSSTGDNPATAKPSPSPTTPASSIPAAAPQPAPPPPPPVSAQGLHDNIITTIFWVGEAADASNAHISNAQSAWDGNWEAHFGGFDDPDNRNGYYPAGFTPNENPFYAALPYNDLDEEGDRKPTAGNCPNTSSGISWCKNAWIKITKGGKAAYAQWQDVGPLQEDDVAYVFGSAAPKNTWGAKAGLDVSPAVRDYLGLSDIDRTSWSFVSAASVPAGPWKNIVTTNPGGW
jgi:hypothetical protein